MGELVARGFRARSSEKNRSDHAMVPEEFQSFYTTATPIGPRLGEDVNRRDPKSLPTFSFSLTFLIGLSNRLRSSFDLGGHVCAQSSGFRQRECGCAGLRQKV